MDEQKLCPKIAGKKSIAVNLDPGKYAYCTCGLSKDQPFCDGAHEGTGFQPKRFFIDQPTQAYLCLCKHTKKSPFCDGSHKKLPVED